MPKLLKKNKNKLLTQNDEYVKVFKDKALMATYALRTFDNSVVPAMSKSGYRVTQNGKKYRG